MCSLGEFLCVLCVPRNVTLAIDSIGGHEDAHYLTSRVLMGVIPFWLEWLDRKPVKWVEVKVTTNT